MPGSITTHSSAKNDSVGNSAVIYAENFKQTDHAGVGVIAKSLATGLHAEGKQWCGDDEPSTGRGKRRLVHEFTHAWQYQHGHFVGRACEILETRIDEAIEGRGEVYSYSPGREWSDYSMEQQAAIVADWYSARVLRDSGPGTGVSSTADRDDDRYIRENISLGR